MGGSGKRVVQAGMIRASLACCTTSRPSLRTARSDAGTVCYDGGSMIVEFYGRQGCHLCDEVREELLGMREVVEFELREIDIRSDPALFARYRYDVPVVLVDGMEWARHRIVDPAGFEERLERQAAERR